MNDLLTKLILIGLVLMAIIAPFAGLAPLMLLLLGFVALWGVRLLLQALLTGNTTADENELNSKSDRKSTT
jgi:hypothetical protein